MGFDIRKSFSVNDNGITIDNGCSYLSGSGHPNSITVLEPTYYFRNNGELWYNPGSSTWSPINSRKIDTDNQVISYSGDLVSEVTYYNSTNYVNANRIAKSTLSYSGDKLTGEVFVFYDIDGVTVLRTFTSTYSYTGDNLSSSGVVTT